MPDQERQMACQEPGMAPGMQRSTTPYVAARYPLHQPARRLPLKRLAATAAWAMTALAGYPTATAAPRGDTHTVPGDFPTIQACIDAANPGDECLVAPGTYNELINFHGKAITLRSSDGPEVTIIDAGPVPDPGTGKPVVRCDTGEGPDTVLDGFTITGGTGSVCFSTLTCGGGMYNQNNSNPTVANCVFTGNSASWGGGIFNHNDSSPTVTNCAFAGNSAIGEFARGGGMSNGDNSNPTVTNCTFARNSAIGEFARGGGMNNVSASNPTLSNCTFTENTSYRSGGGMNNAGASPTLTNCTFSGNTATGGLEASGGGMSNAGGSPTITNCTFDNNAADDDGGGMRNFNSSPTVTDSTFSHNSALWGAGMRSEGSGSSPTVTNCTFTRNSTMGNFVFGGGMYNNGNSTTVTDCVFTENSSDDGGGAIVNENDNATITNCTFRGNTSSRGGGIYNIKSNPSVTKCTFTGNSASMVGGGMYNHNDSNPTLANCLFSGNSAADFGGALISLANSSPTLINCTLSENSAGSAGGAMFNTDEAGGHSSLLLRNCVLWANVPSQIEDQFGALTTVSRSLVQGGWPGIGNIDEDPRFADPAGFDGIMGTEDDDLRLTPRSPCIDAGQNSPLPVDVLTDLDGYPRFFDDPLMPDTGLGAAPIVDMGAYEFGSGACADGSQLTILLCHQSQENPTRSHTIRAPVNQALDHFAHGDTCGPCRRARK